MTPEQNKARNEAYQLISIAARILGGAGLDAYSDDVAHIAAGMKQDAQMLERQERNRRMAGA